jgi:hypothetical protein
MVPTTHGPVNPLSSNESFTLDYVFEGRHPRLYSGDFPDWSTNAARQACRGPYSICCVA